MGRMCFVTRSLKFSTFPSCCRLSSYFDTYRWPGKGIGVEGAEMRRGRGSIPVVFIALLLLLGGVLGGVGGVAPPAPRHRSSLGPGSGYCKFYSSL
jgi:hypothetical protein